jgi:small subunit ribosomal protein S4
MRHRAPQPRLPASTARSQARLSDYGIHCARSRRSAASMASWKPSSGVTYKEADRRKGVTGENLLQILESRLDSVVYRMGFGASRTESRQAVRHNAIKVNGRRVNIPSYQVKPGDVVEVSDKARGQLRIKAAVEAAESRGFPEWVEVDAKAMKGTFKALPQRSELPATINGAVRARLRPHAGQRAAPRAAVVDGGLCADRSDDRRRAARVLGHRRRAGRRRRTSCSTSRAWCSAAQPRRSHAGAAQGGRRPGHGADIQTRTTSRSSTPSTSLPTWRKAASSTCRSRSRRAAATCRATCAATATSRPRASAASCWTRRSRRSPRQLRGRERPRRAAHRPRQAGDGDRDQRRHPAEEAIASRARILVEQLAFFAQLEGTPVMPMMAQPAPRDRTSTPSCCVRSTSSS